MSFEELARARYSVRKFEARPIEAPVMQKLLEMAALTPTGCNKQPQRVYVLQSEDARAKAAKCTPCTFDAPAVILVCYDRDAAWHRDFDGYDCGEFDASIFVTHLTFAAVELGLGTCIVAYFDPAETRRLFNLPPSVVPMAMLPIGYPAAPPSPVHTKRNPYTDYTTIL